MRIRTIKPEFYSDEELCELPALNRILFTGLWGLADKEGRLEYRPRFIKVQVLPYDECNIESMLEVLSYAGFIEFYDVEDRNYIQVLNFKKHQRISGKEYETESEFPSPPSKIKPRKLKEKSRSNGEAIEKHPGSTREAPVKHPESQEGKGREGKGKEGKDIAPAEAAAFPPDRRESPGHVQLVEGFQEVYQQLTGAPFKIDQKHWVIAANLVKQHGYPAAVDKVKVLGVLCRDRAAWFTRDGMGSFSLETLSSQWNRIIPEIVPPSKDEELLAEIRKREESRVRSDAIVNGNTKIANS